MKSKLYCIAMAFIAVCAVAIINCQPEPPLPEKFTVTFNANGGEPTPPQQTIEKGKKVTEPQNVTKANNIFDGWYKESGFTTKWNFANDTVTADITLYAKWTETSAHTHQWGDWIVTTAPTETAEGIETKTCSTCGEKETRPIDKLTHTHEFGTAWVKNATQHWHECSCGEKTDIANHTWDWVVTTPATPTTDGVETRTCSICEEEETRATDKLPEVPKDQTAVITGLFDNNASATVKGNLTDTEWDGIADKIKTALNDRFAGRPDDLKNTWRSIFGVGVTIIVETSPNGYTNWKTIGDGETIYISFAATNADNLGNLLGSAIAFLSGNASANDGTPVPGTTPILNNSTEPVVFAEGVSYDVNFSGTFLEAEWPGIVASVKTALVATYGSAPGAGKGVMRRVFGDGVTIVVEKDPVGYTNYKVGADFKTVSINVDSIESVDYRTVTNMMDIKDPDDPAMIGKVVPEKKAGSVRMAYMRES
jgi:uncharacterized repeat protein (TIGR02543 family)